MLLGPVFYGYALKSAKMFLVLRDHNHSVGDSCGSNKNVSIFYHHALAANCCFLSGELFPNICQWKHSYLFAKPVDHFAVFLRAFATFCAIQKFAKRHFRNKEGLCLFALHPFQNLCIASKEVYANIGV